MATLARLATEHPLKTCIDDEPTKVIPGDGSQRFEIRRMWESGPLRQWSEKKTTQCQMAYSGEIAGFVGAYVCERCLTSTAGVYRVQSPENWLCPVCRRELRERSRRKCPAMIVA